MNRQIRLASRPKGLPHESDFELNKAPMPTIADGEFLVEIVYLSVDPYMRGRMNDSKSYADPVQIGAVMVGEAVGRVRESNHSKFPRDTWVCGMFGWQEFAQSNGEGVRRIRNEDAPVSTALHVLGMPGITSYFGIHDVCKLHRNQTLLVSAAAGAVGSTAGQLAKGFADGPRLKSKFNQLYCAAWGPGKTKIYIADLKNQRVRYVDMKTGEVKTVAGNGKRGIPKDGSDALKSPLVDPRAVGVDSKGNVYIADRGGHALRVLKPDGKIYTLVNKKGKKGRALGEGPNAQLFGPKYVAIDKDDKVYIADDQNHRICVYDPETKQLTSLIGLDSKLKGWDIKRPHGVTIHKDGSIYVVDSGNDRILKMVKKK